MNDGKEIVWSERDGWSHLYLYDGATDQIKNQITRGQWVVRGVQRVDETNRQIWFSAGATLAGKDPYFLSFFRIFVRHLLGVKPPPWNQSTERLSTAR